MPITAIWHLKTNSGQPGALYSDNKHVAFRDTSAMSFLSINTHKLFLRDPRP